jgi:hypothetical protein
MNWTGRDAFSSISVPEKTTLTHVTFSNNISSIIHSYTVLIPHIPPIAIMATTSGVLPVASIDVS